MDVPLVNHREAGLKSLEYLIPVHGAVLEPDAANMDLVQLGTIV